MHWGLNFLLAQLCSKFGLGRTWLTADGSVFKRLFGTPDGLSSFCRNFRLIYNSGKSCSSSLITKGTNLHFIFGKKKKSPHVKDALFVFVVLERSDGDKAEATAAGAGG